MISSLLSRKKVDARRDERSNSVASSKRSKNSSVTSSPVTVRTSDDYVKTTPHTSNSTTVSRTSQLSRMSGSASSMPTPSVRVIPPRIRLDLPKHLPRHLWLVKSNITTARIMDALSPNINVPQGFERLLQSALSYVSPAYQDRIAQHVEENYSSPTCPYELDTLVRDIKEAMKRSS